MLIQWGLRMMVMVRLPVGNKQSTNRAIRESTDPNNMKHDVLNQTSSSPHIRHVLSCTVNFDCRCTCGCQSAINGVDSMGLGRMVLANVTHSLKYNVCHP